jgi:hypothetical protein
MAAKKKASKYICSKKTGRMICRERATNKIVSRAVVEAYREKQKGKKAAPKKAAKGKKVSPLKGKRGAMYGAKCTKSVKKPIKGHTRPVCVKFQGPRIHKK